MRSRNMRWFPTKSMTINLVLPCTLAQAATKLLKENHRRLRGPEHHHTVRRPGMSTPSLKMSTAHTASSSPWASCSRHSRAVPGARSGEHGLDPNTALAEPVTGESGMLDGATEDQGVGTRVLGPGGHSRSMRRCVCTAAASSAGSNRRFLQGIGIVDIVAQAVVGERDQTLLLDADPQVRPVGDEVIEESEDVPLVGPIRGRGEPEQEGRIQTIEQPTVAGRIGVVDLVHDDVVERPATA